MSRIFFWEYIFNKKQKRNIKGKCELKRGCWCTTFYSIKNPNRSKWCNCFFQSWTFRLSFEPSST